MTAPATAYPLTWPANRPRTAGYREYARFKSTVGKELIRVRNEVRLLGGSGLIISSNLELRLDGEPKASSRVPTDPGVAVYFNLRKLPMCFACDRWNKVEDNVRAITLTIEALRGIERWGSGQMVRQAFTGFTALPAPEQPFQVLGVRAAATEDEIMSAYRGLISKHHPDKPGGDHDTMVRLNAARDAMLEALAGGEALKP